VERFLDIGSRQVVDALVTAAEGLDCSPAELALAWVRDQPGVVAPIVGARTAAQLRGTLSSEDIEVPGPIRAALDEVSLAV
jgi:aryl-alcohol dehydrogenase-like predicted oxidoreductase